MRGLRLALLLHLAPVMSIADWNNPFILNRADPWILRHADGRYYMTATTPAYDQLELRAADTLEDLAVADASVVWRKNASGPLSYHIWAPELHSIDGRWYLYFAASRADDIWAIRMYVFENASPDPLLGKWVNRGQIRTRWETFALDATTFEHRGQRYLVWAQHEPDMGSNTCLWISRMENPWTLAGPQVRLSAPGLPWEQRLFKVNEGPAVLLRNGRVFIAYSASGTDHNYCMGLLWADADADLLDPASWHKSPEPVFRTSERNGIYGPGHNSFTTTADGRDVLVYHARSYRDIMGDPLDDPNRHTRLQVFGWSEDGFPVFGEPEAEKPASESALLR